ncbi:MAG: hypothetical protein IT200_11665 [Thermoleophilia bacterium]|nr:hypothetical protein [Thermoleophilia bacterium]
MTDREWLEAYAALLGIPAPDDEEFDLLLQLAGVAAHASERRAAPVACWMAARCGLAPDDALRLARAIPGDPG